MRLLFLEARIIIMGDVIEWLLICMKTIGSNCEKTRINIGNCFKWYVPKWSILLGGSEENKHGIKKLI